MKFIDEFLNYLNIDLIQFTVLVFGVTEVLLARANSVWLYPAGIIATTLSIYSLYHVKLYAECLLHLYYLAMSMYGWYYWQSKQHGTSVNISYNTSKDWYITIAIVASGWLLLYFFLLYFTTSDNPIWDSWVSATGWAGMWLLARRKVENWILLNISNAFAIPLLFSKGLSLFAVLTIILFIVACKGYMDWTTIARKKSKLHDI